MPFHVCNGATLKCDFAVPPGISSFVVLPIHRMITSDQPAANINDHVPMTTVLPVAGIGMSIFLNMCRGISCVHCSHRRSGCWREDQQNGWPVGRPSHTKPKSRDCHAACIP